jgi:GNAT superfamily N-acetyltransferase
VVEPLLDNPRSLVAKVAAVLGGRAIERPGLSGFVNSEFDPFLNQLFAADPVTPLEAVEALEGRPGFIWLAEPLSVSELGVAEAERLSLVEMYGMTASTAPPATSPRIEAEIVEVHSQDELRAWLAVYFEVFGGDDRGSRDWQGLHDALDSAENRFFSLLLARMEGVPAAIGSVYFEPNVAGLYNFATRERVRGRGLASALVHASQAVARARGVERTLLHATAMGRPVYSRAGYRLQRPLQQLRAH